MHAYIFVHNREGSYLYATLEKAYINTTHKLRIPEMPRSSPTEGGKGDSFLAPCTLSRMLVAAFDIRDLSAFIFQKKTKKKRNIEKEILIVYFGSSDLIQFDTLLGGLNTIPEVLDPQIFEHGWGLVKV